MNIYSVLIVTILGVTGYKGSKVLLSLFALELGASPASIGVLLAFYGVGPLLLAVMAGKMMDRFGFFWPLLFGTICFVLGLALPGAIPRIPTLYASAVLLGTGFVFFAVGVQSLVGALGTPETRTRDFSIFSLGPAIASFLGPLAAGFSVDHVGHARGYLLLSITAVLGALMVLFWRTKFPRPKVSGNTGDSNALDLWRSASLRDMFFVSAIVITALELFTFFMPIYGHSIGISASAIGVVISAYALAAIGVRIFLPALTRRHGEGRVMTWSMYAAAATFVLFPFFQNAWILTAVSFLLGIGLGSGQPLANVLAYNRAPPGRIGEVIGMRLTVNKLAEVACPLVFGAVGAAFGVTLVFAANAVLLAAGATLNRRRETM